MDPKKLAAEWFRNTVFRNETIRITVSRKEAIRSKPPKEPERVPVAIRAARALAISGFHSWQSRESVFLKQAKLLEFCEDDYSFDCTGLVIYYPTYQTLTDRQLRAYLSWRTRLRRGELAEAPLTFAFLYIYELLNQIGVSGPMDGYRKLTEFRDAYGPINEQVLPYLERWRVDYVVYYNLDPALLSDTDQVVRDRCIEVLSHIQEREDGEVLAALRQLSSWLGRSKFYAACQDDMDRVMLRVLRKIEAHCAKLKNTMLDRYFGGYAQNYVDLFGSAVFCDPLNRKDYTYRLDGQCVYSCKSGSWLVRKRCPTPRTRGKFDNLLKTIDAALRDTFEYGHPIKTQAESQWVLRAIQEEVRRLLEEKRAAEAKKVTIDFGQLSRIRRDASITQEKLIVEEETEPVEETAYPPSAEESPLPPLAASRLSARSCGGRLPPANTAPPLTRGAVGYDTSARPLTVEETRLLHCLLYGGGLEWVQREGLLLSVLVDGINEKLYDTFQDSVLDDTPCLFEDYIDDLKEMIRP